MQPLPRARFDAVEWVERKADKEGNMDWLQCIRQSDEGRMT